MEHYRHTFLDLALRSSMFLSVSISSSFVCKVVFF